MTLDVVARTNNTPSTRARIVERRTYLRPLNEDGTIFETPTDMIDRVIDHQRWLWETQVSRRLNALEEGELVLLRRLIEERKVSMSGRVKWMGGTDLVKLRSSAAFNCLGVETRFITDQGVRSFADFNHGDEVNVWTHKGRWRKAVVKSYGEQRLDTITFGRGKTSHDVRATDNHRWLLDGDKGETTELAVRDRIARPVSDFAAWDFDAADVDEQTWWAYGFVYGDGTITRKNGNATGSMVRLCGDKARYLDRFIELGFGYSFPPSCNDDPMVYTGRYRKTLPQAGDDIRLIRAFVRGYLDADGTAPNGYNGTFSRILATSEEAKTFIREFFPVVGMFVASERVANQETNYGARSNEAVWFNIFDTCGKSTNSSFNVRAIEPGEVETVWCLEVEEDHSFTLANGIVTGNCSFTEVASPADLVDVFWLLLQGCGVGFKPIEGLLTGFSTKVKRVLVVPSTRTDKGGAENNSESYDPVKSVWTIKVGDSAKAWAKALGKIMAGKFPAETLVIDLSELRPAGRRLKGYGWLSSGWKSLEKALRRVAELMIKAAGRALTALEIGEIVNWLGTVLSSRRSAQIWLLDASHELAGTFADYKEDRYTYRMPDGSPMPVPEGLGFAEVAAHAEKLGATNNVQREQSNNSLVFWEKPARSVIHGLLTRILRGGEPGFINGAEAKRRAPEYAGCNPCVTADTWVETSHGPRRVSDLIDRPFTAIVNGMPYEATGFWKTGDKPVFRLRTTRGYEVRATDNHQFLVETNRRWNKKVNGYDTERKWIELKDIKPGDKLVLDDRSWIDFNPVLDEFDAGWLVGEVVGDGGHNPHAYPTYLRFWGENGKEMAERAVDLVRAVLEPTVHFKGAVHHSGNGTWDVRCKALQDLAARFIEPKTKAGTDALETASLSFCAGFLRGLFDADGSVQGNFDKGVSLRLDQSDLDRLKLAQRMLLRLGIASSIYEDRRSDNVSVLPDGRGGSAKYAVKPLHSLVVSKDNIVRFERCIGFYDPAKAAALVDILSNRSRVVYKDQFTAEVAEIVAEGVEAVYDVTVDGVHRFAANGVIAHNCAEILLPNKGFCNLVQVIWHRFNGDLKGLLQAQYLAGRANYRQTCVSMRDGVLQIGWNDNQHLLRLCGVAPLGYVSWEGLNDPDMLREVRRAAVEGADSMADAFGTPYARRVTQVQPGGTSSKHMGLEGDEVHEGAHLALSRWIFNNINITRGEPLVDALRAAHYDITDHPTDPTAVVVKIPVEYPASPLFTRTTMVIDGREEEVEVNLESAVSQLERYRLLMEHYVDHNCFTGSTRFLTAEKGLAAFNDFEDGETVSVMDRQGHWTPATVKSFGEQKVWRVTVERSRTRHVIETTAGHRWPVSSAQDRLKGREVWTTTDKLAGFIGKKNLATVLPDLGLDLDETAVLRGIVYGDGTLYNYPNTLSKVTLCGDIAQGRSKVDLLPLFEKLGYTGSPVTAEGYRTVHGLPATWKRSLPCIETSTPAELRGFIAGWFAADGSVSGGVATIGSSDMADLEWLQQAAPKAGIAVMTEVKVQDRTGYGVEPKSFHSLVISKASLDPSFFLLDWKKLDGDFGVKHWKIISVEETDRVEPVFCVMEPKAHEFVLEGNILTGNCSITISFDETEIDAMADWFMAHWDSFVGVSFIRRNDPTKTARDLGFAYLPQQAVSKRLFEKYTSQLLPLDLSTDDSGEMLDMDDCSTGSCPVR